MGKRKHIAFVFAIGAGLFFSGIPKTYGQSGNEIKFVFNENDKNTVQVVDLTSTSFRSAIEYFYDNFSNLQKEFNTKDQLFRAYCKKRNTLDASNKALEVSDYFIFNGFEIIHYDLRGNEKSRIAVSQNSNTTRVREGEKVPTTYSTISQNKIDNGALTIHPDKGKGREAYKKKILTETMGTKIPGRRGRIYILDHIQYYNPELSEHHELTLSGNSLSFFNSSTGQNFIIDDITDPHGLRESGLANINTDTISLPEHFYTIENGKVVHNCVVNAQNYQTALIQYTLTKKDAMRTIVDLEYLQEVDSLSKSKYSYIEFQYETICDHIVAHSKIGQRNVFDVYARTNYGHNFTYFIGIVGGVYGFRAADSNRGFKKNDGNPQIKSLLYHIENFYFEGEVSHVTQEDHYVKNIFIRRIPDSNFIIKKVDNKTDSNPNNTIPGPGTKASNGRKGKPKR